MAEEVEMDQAVYDALIAEGKSERIARSKAKAGRGAREEGRGGRDDRPRAASAEAPEAAAPGRRRRTRRCRVRRRRGGTRSRTGVARRAASPRGGASAAWPPPWPRRATAAATRAGAGNGLDPLRRPGPHPPPARDGVRRTASSRFKGSRRPRSTRATPDRIGVHLHPAWTIGIAIFSRSSPPRCATWPTRTSRRTRPRARYFLGCRELLRYFHPMARAS